MSLQKTNTIDTTIRGISKMMKTTSSWTVLITAVVAAAAVAISCATWAIVTSQRLARSRRTVKSIVAGAAAVEETKQATEMPPAAALFGPCVSSMPRTGLPNVLPGPLARNRIALLMPCYNMPEAALNILTQLPQRIGKDHIIDAFIVDNGSKTHPLPPDAEIMNRMQAPLQDGAAVNLHIIRMPTNVQTTHGFHLAMTAARGVAFNEKFQYEAYWLWITSQVLPPPSSLTPQDITTPLLTALRDDPKLGAITPAMWPKFDESWDAFGAMELDLDVAESSFPVKPALLTDILGMMVLGPLFETITREGFQPTLLRGWSVDVDLCATILKAGYSIGVHHGVVLEKAHAIGYKMNRMSENPANTTAKIEKRSRCIPRRKIRSTILQSPTFR